MANDKKINLQTRAWPQGPGNGDAGVLSGMEEMAIMDSFDTTHLFEVVSIECSDIEPENDVRWQQTESMKNPDSSAHGKIIALDQFRPAKTLLNE